jgi:DNA polymerase III gamma/tau subunit
MKPPGELLPRFLSRCMVLNFEPVPQKALALYLEDIWDKEHGPRHYPIEYFEQLAEGMGVRDALMRLDSELLAPRSAAEIKRILAEQKAAKMQQEQIVESSPFLMDDAAAVRLGRQIRAAQLQAASQA